MILIEIPPVSPPLKPRLMVLLFSLDRFSKKGGKTPTLVGVFGFSPNWSFLDWSPETFGWSPETLNESWKNVFIHFWRRLRSLVPVASRPVLRAMFGRLRQGFWTTNRYGRHTFCFCVTTQNLCAQFARKLRKMCKKACFWGFPENGQN